MCLVRLSSILIIVACCSVHFMAVGALAMKHRSTVAASQQLFADTPAALVANIQHK
jgi:NO-binding membrane sensor protein with MHYT domain